MMNLFMYKYIDMNTNKSILHSVYTTEKIRVAEERFYVLIYFLYLIYLMYLICCKKRPS